MAFEDAPDQGRRVVEADPGRYRLNEREASRQALQEGFLPLVGEGHHEGELGVAQAHGAGVGDDELAAHDHLGLVEVGLGILARLVGQRNHRQLGTRTVRDGTVRTDIAADGALGAREPILVAQPLPDAVGGMALLLRALLVLKQPLVDNRDDRPEYRRGARLLQGVLLGSGVL